MTARIIRITVDEGATGLLYATSPDVEGLLVAGRTAEALDAAIPAAISDLYAACGENVVAIPAQLNDDDQTARSYVEFPAEVAQAALNKIAERRLA
jgi:hypothetical protein